MFSKSQLIDEYWFDFLDWCSSPRNYAGMGNQYEFRTIVNVEGTGIRTPLATENNFWSWFLEYKFESIKQSKSVSFQIEKKPDLLERIKKWMKK